MSEILERLDRWTRLRTGEAPPINNWGETLQQDIRDAIEEIRRLRSVTGPVSIAPIAIELYRDLRHGAAVGLASRIDPPPVGHQSDTDQGG